MVKDKKALFVSYNAGSEPLVKSQVLPYLYALSGKGVEFSLLTFEKDSSDLDKLSRELEKNGIGWKRLKFHGHPVVFSKAFDIINGFFTVLYLCIRRNIGLVHSRGIMSAVMSMLPARMAGAYFIFDMKSSLAEAYRLSGRIKTGSFSYRILTFLEKACVSNADEVIVETGFHKALLENQMPRLKKRLPITVLPCCVEVERFSPASRCDSHKPAGEGAVLVYLGSLSGWYMISEMLDFFKVMKDKLRNSRFIFLTDDKDGQLAHLTTEKGISCVDIIKVSYNDVPVYLSDATAGLLFKWPNERLDSFPIKIGEYLASGLPIIINAGMGDVEELILRNRIGVVVKSCDEASYLKAIGDLGILLREGAALRKRCSDIAAKYLSSSFGILQYENIYKRYFFPQK